MRFWKTKKAPPPEQVKFASYFLPLGAATRTPATFPAMAKEGYGDNPIVHACIDKIASAAGSMDLLVYKKGKGGKVQKVEGDHPLKTLIADRPNPLESGRIFIDRLFRYWLISGDAYIRKSGPAKDAPRELYLLNPAKMKIVPGEGTPFPRQYEYKPKDTAEVYPVDRLTGKSDILHIKKFNPLDPWYGLPPMSAAAYAIDVFNAGQQWNLGLLQNGARPSGALMVKGKDGTPAKLTDRQFADLKQDIDQQYSGGYNAGRPLLLEGGVEWQEMSMNSRDMDFKETMLNNARFIASVFGVPPMLVNVPGDSTYANFEQARMALWTDTVLPSIGVVLDEFNRWFAPYFDNTFIWYDEEMIPALEPLREQRFARMANAKQLTINEKREATGYDTYVPSDNPADAIFVSTTDIPLELAGDIGLAEPGAPSRSPQNEDQNAAA
jgi:HK97 family phage portal protein